MHYTNSAYRDILAGHIEKIYNPKTFYEPFHFIIKTKFHLRMLRDLEGKFIEELTLAAHSAITTHYMKVHITQKNPNIDEQTMKQEIIKIHVGPNLSWKRFRGTVIPKIAVTFSIDRSLINVRTISSLSKDDIDTLVSFEASIIGEGDRLAQIAEVQTSKGDLVVYDKYNPKEHGAITKKYWEYLQYVTIEEIKPEKDNVQSYKITLKLPNTMVSKTKETKKYIITGFYRVEKGEEPELPLYIQGVSINPIENKKAESLSSSEIEHFRKLAVSDPNAYLHKLTDSYAPHIFGNHTAKLGMLLAHLKNIDLGSYRAEMFLLLIGVPGTGKSEILKYMGEIHDNFIYNDSQGVSTRGLLFSQIEYKKQKILHRGVMLKYENVVIDEFDKLKPEDQKALNTVIEQRIATYTKSPFSESAKITANLSIGANPTNSKWIPEKGILKNLESVGDTIVDRAVIVLVTSNKDTENKLNHIFGTIMGDDITEPPIPKKQLAALYEYASVHKPSLTQSSVKLMKAFLIAFSKIEQSDNQDLPIETRKELDLVRISVKMAQLLLRDEVDGDSVKYAIEFYKSCMESVGMNTNKPTTNQSLENYDGSKNDYFWIIFNALAKDSDTGRVTESKLKENMDHSGKWKTVEQINEFLSKMRDKGSIFEPLPGELLKG